MPDEKITENILAVKKASLIKLSVNGSLLGKMQYNARVRAAFYSRNIVINNYLKLVNG